MGAVERRVRSALLGAAACCLGLAAWTGPWAGAAAQQAGQADVDRQREIERQERDRARAADAADSAVGLEAAGPPPTYDEVLAQPDDVALNVRWARALLGSGDLQGAAATLERILRAAPEASSARLLYAIVLFRLDMKTEADRELATLAAAGLPADQAAEVERYRARIALQRQRLVTTASVTAGAHIDSNRNSAPNAYAISFLGGGIANTARKNRDVGLLTVATADLTYDLGEQRPHRVFASLGFSNDDQREERTLDLMAYTGQVGGVYASGLGELTLAAGASHLRLNDKPFVTTVGARMKLERPIVASLTGEVELRGDWETYHNTQTDLTRQERSGPKTAASVGLRYAAAPWLSIGASGTVTDKRAKEKFRFNDYQGYAGGLSGVALLPRGAFLVLSVDAERRLYTEPDPFVAPERERADWQLVARLTAGIPLGGVPGLDFLPAPLRDVRLIGSFEYLRNYSSIKNFSYENRKYQVLVNKTFQF